jgi:hypothetical protein
MSLMLTTLVCGSRRCQQKLRSRNKIISSSSKESADADNIKNSLHHQTTIEIEANEVR